MPLDPAELLRGRIVFAIFAFAPEFPVDVIDSSGGTISFPDAEAYAKARKGDTTKFVVEARLRPILLLHDGLRGDSDDVICLRVNSVKSKHRHDGDTWRKIEEHEHPFFFHLPAGSYGLQEESIISLTSIGAINKSAIVDIKPRGGLNSHEMQIVSERLTRVLSLDLAPLIAKQAKELMKRAGIGGP